MSSSKSYKSNFHNGFPSWIANELKDARAHDVQTHQAIASKYISTKTPYRGILLYHGLGTGKTRSSISIAESGGFKSIIVILPAALKQNFVKELQSFLDLSSVDLDVHLSKYSFIHSNGLTQKSLGEFDVQHFDDKLIIIDEVHNITGGLSNPKGIKYQLYNKLLKAKNSRFVLMSATPIINKPVEIAFIINLLRGDQTVYSMNVKGVPNRRYLKEFLMDNRYVNTSEARLLDDDVLSISFTLTPNEFIKSDGMLFKLKRSRSDEKRLQSIRKKLAKMKTSEGKPVKLLRSKFQSKANYALPFSESDFNDRFSDPETGNIFKRRIAGSVSYFRQNENDDRFADVEVIEEKVPFSEHQYGAYEAKRSEEIQTERSQSSHSVYKAYSRAVCNFAFPTGLERPFPKDFRGRSYVLSELDEQSPGEYESRDVEVAESENSDKESDNDMGATKKSEYNSKINDIMRRLEEIDLVDQLETLSPKFQRVSENIYKSNGISIIYTDFRKVEGIGILKLVFEKKGYGEMEVYTSDGEYRVRFPEGYDNYYIDYGSRNTNNSEADKISLMILNNEFDKLAEHVALLEDLKNRFGTGFSNVRGKMVNLIFLTRSGSEGISMRNVRDVHILEPYWNQTRVKQVIGRAVRMDSHVDLDRANRNVTVYKYMSVFSPEQKARALRSKTLKSDVGMTTDELVKNIATKKAEDIDRFLKYLQESSIDCEIHDDGSEKQCLTEVHGKSPEASMFSFDIDADAVIVDSSTLASSAGEVPAFKVKFKQGPLAEDKGRAGFIYLPHRESLFDTKSGLFRGTMKKISRSKYKIDLIDSL